MIRRAAALACLVVLLTACLPEDMGGDFVIVNQTDQPLFHGTNRLAPGGGRHILSLRDCGESTVTGWT